MVTVQMSLFTPDLYGCYLSYYGQSLGPGNPDKLGIITLS